MLHALQTRRLDRAFAAQPRARSVAAMRAHLARCTACQRRYERQLVAEAALPDGHDRASDRLWQEIRVVAAPERPAPRRWALSFALATPAALAAVLLVPRALHHQDGFVARGGPPGVAMLPALHVFHAVGGTAAEPVVDQVRASDGLLFAYS